jgi:CheY-like chemotaxis protein
LIVEDNKTDIFLIRQAIERCKIDAHIHVVRDGYAAVRYIDAAKEQDDAQCPDLILLDLNLPNTSGHDVLKHLRTNSRCRHTRVLVVSSSTLPQERSSLKDLDIAGYFEKPSSFAEFMKLGVLIEDLMRSHDPATRDSS